MPIKATNYYSGDTNYEALKKVHAAPEKYEVRIKEGIGSMQIVAIPKGEKKNFITTLTEKIFYYNKNKSLHILKKIANATASPVGLASQTKI